MERIETLEEAVMAVLTEQNDIASTGIAGLRPGEIDPSSVESLVAEGLNNLKQLAPKHDPIRGHRASSHDEGASYFSGDGTPKGVPAKAMAAPGHGGFDAARVIEAEYGGQIGVYAPPSRPIEGTIHIIPYHGDRLQAITTKEESKWQAGKPQPTSIASFVFTNEGGTWVLASAYPGKADPEPNFEGLKAGAVISPEEAAKRNLRVKCVEKENQNAV